MAPQRTCIGCRSVADRSALVRFVRDERGVLVVDSRGRRSGRGAYVHRERTCLQRAIASGAFQRALRGRVALVPQGHQDGVQQALERLWTTLDASGP